MPNLNLSGSLNILRLFANPALCLPHHTVSSFDKIPVPLSEAFTTSKTDNKKPDIRAIVLDKDNCFAIPHQNEIFPANKAKFEELRQAYPGSKLLIVSNSSGTGADPGFKDAELLEKNTGVTVLRHNTKKPGCSGEIMDYFCSRPDSQVTKPEQVAIVGDRLFTDMMMANMMGAHSLWVRDGVVEDRNIVSVQIQHPIHAFQIQIRSLCSISLAISPESRQSTLLSRRHWSSSIMSMSLMSEPSCHVDQRV
jgi:phosphatidylglycerophosphatase GEP4